MKIQFHDSYERKLIELASTKNITPSKFLRDIIDCEFQKIDNTPSVQGSKNEREENPR